MNLFSFPWSKPKVIINPPTAFETTVWLVRHHKIPLEKLMLQKIGEWEGLSPTFVESILSKTNLGPTGLHHKEVCEWCLKRIVFALVKTYRVVDEDLYKVLVNLVNSLSLSFSFLDRTIAQSKKFAKTFESDKVMG